MQWVQATTIEQLRSKKRVMYRSHDKKQIVIFWAKESAFAIDNRCPHEGYPLKDGILDEDNCLLTCAWHNWKFELKDGNSVFGGDAVRTYPTQLKDEHVWLDLSEPTPEERTARILKGLKGGFERRNYGQMSRELARLKLHGLEPLDAIRAAIRWSFDRLEYGMTHAYGVTADWLSFAKRTDATEAEELLAWTEAIDHMAFDSLRHPQYPFPEKSLPFDGDTWLAAIEAEDVEQALQLTQGGIEQELSWETWEKWLTHAALAHFSGFGHSLIFAYKTRELIEHLGVEMIPFLVLPLVRSFCHATREDLLPEFQKYADYLEKCPPLTGTAQEWINSDELERASVSKAMNWVNRHTPTHTVEVLHSTLMASCGRHLLTYDTSFQSDYNNKAKDNVGWLHLTHAITFGNAVRALCQKHPECWQPALLQMACFSGRNVAYTDSNIDISSWDVKEPLAFLEKSLQEVADHGLLTPIFPAHLLKTLWAIREEMGSVSEASEKWLLASLNRFLYESIKEKHTRRTASQSLSLIQKDLA